MESLDPRLIERIDAAFESSTNWFFAASELRKGLQEKDEAHLSPFLSAFEYDLVGPERSDRREQFGPFAPVFEGENGTYPPRLAEAPREWLRQWEMLAKQSRSPAVRSRFNDLLWVSHAGDDPHVRAQAAIDDYLAQADVWSDLEAGSCLCRALELSREINDSSRQSRIVDALVTHARMGLRDEEWKPGVPLRLIAALVELPAAEQPPETGELLATARERYETDPWITQSVIELEVIRSRSDETRVRELRAEEVTRWRQEAAEASDELLHFAHLQHALELARVHGVTNQAKEIRLELQDFDHAQLDLKRVGASGTIPAAEVESLIEAIVGSSWQEGLTRFGAFGPPTGDYEDNATAVKALMQQHPIQFLFQRVILGPENTIIRRPSTDEEQFAAQLVRYEHQRTLFWASIAVEILGRIHERHEHPDVETLTGFFTTELVSPEVAEAFARSFALFWDGLYDEAAHVVVPRLEATIRELSRRVGLVVFREPIDDRPGGIRTLGDLLHGLHGHVDESWRRYLWTLLVEPLGLNLRNLISHGLVNRVEAADTALLLQVASFLRLLGEQEQQPPEAPAKAP